MNSQRVAVLGLGYVGLPLIRACVAAGHQVLGFDIDADVVASLSSGLSHVDDVHDAEIAEWLKRGFAPTANPNDLEEIDAFIICVPTPLSLDGSPNLAAVEAAVRTIASRVEATRTPLVVLESTSYPGTTEEIVKPILESVGLVAAQDFSLAFSPERIDPGNKQWTFENTPKIVGGLTEQCADRAVAFYSTLTSQVVRTKGLKEAEMAKLLENTYRHVNIALVNELAKVSDLLGIDFWDVIAAAETKPYGFQAFWPGPGVGGHCIPIDPNYLGHRVRTELGQTLRFVELAQEINSSMPAYVVQRVVNLLGRHELSIDSATVLLLGVTYKPNVSDLRESPAIAVVRELRRLGATVQFHDPLVSQWVVDGEQVVKCEDLAECTARASASVLLQTHAFYLENREQLKSRILLDTQGQLSALGTMDGAAWTAM